MLNIPASTSSCLFDDRKDVLCIITVPESSSDCVLSAFLKFEASVVPQILIYCLFLNYSSMLFTKSLDTVAFM